MRGAETDVRLIYTNSFVCCQPASERGVWGGLGGPGADDTSSVYIAPLQACPMFSHSEEIDKCCELCQHFGARTHGAHAYFMDGEQLITCSPRLFVYVFVRVCGCVYVCTGI